MHKKLCAQKLEAVLLESRLIEKGVEPPSLVELDIEAGAQLLEKGVAPKDIRDHGFGSITGNGNGFINARAVVDAAHAKGASRGGNSGNKSGGKGRS